MQAVYLRAIVMGHEWGCCELANPVLVRGTHSKSPRAIPSKAFPKLYATSTIIEVDLDIFRLLGIFEDKLTVTPIGVAKLMTLPESMNLTALSTETTSWRNEFAIPYPTYFHPSTDNEVPRDLVRLVLHEIKEIIPVSGASQREQSRSPY
ncbi:hypothetical protein D5086_004274 [Populus alba]|uniref:Uncharacterized protein n=1 Tax=Populus alba TaxID=43335 RepID=A0ACC4CPX6_POPAL